MTMDTTYVKALQYGVEKTLPSGLVVRLRPVDASILLGQALPRPLMQIVEKHFGIDKPEVLSAEAQDAENFEEAKAIMAQNGTIKTLLDIRAFGEVVARVCFVWPRISDDPHGDDEISAAWLDSNDLRALTSIVGMPLAELMPFRFEQDAPLESVRPVESSLPDAEQGVRDEPLVEEPVGAGLAAGEMVSEL